MITTSGNTDFLATMAAASAERVARARAVRSIETLRLSSRAAAAPVRWQRSTEGFDLIAEVKWRSPAAGALRAASSEGLDARVEAYARAGATAISVLTEPSRFDGSLTHLEQAASCLRHCAPQVPAMRKDFLVDPYQILEARIAGAGGVLLIVRMLDDSTLVTLLEASLTESLFVLLEVFDEWDVDRAMLAVKSVSSSWSDLGEQVWIGVNSRDLVTLQVVPERLEKMVSYLPHEFPRVAESGVATPADAARLAAVGYDAALVGSALMSGENPTALAGAMLQAARAARAHRARPLRA